MTITIADRRGALWQWDTGRRVKITDGADVKQIHYQNRCFGCSVDVDVEDDGTAIIPDELLQDYHTLTAYAYVTDDKGGYTKVQQDFAVYKRPKPSDYVYTPTEHAGFDRLRAEIGDLDDLTTEDRSTIVAAINEAATCGTDMDITGATVGQIAKITAVDDSGKPTAWEPVDMPEQVQPDWNQNDTTQPDYVKNKPFYLEKTLVVELTKDDFTVNDQDGYIKYMYRSTPKLDWFVSAESIAFEIEIIDTNGRRYTATQDSIDVIFEKDHTDDDYEYYYYYSPLFDIVSGVDLDLYDDEYYYKDEWGILVDYGGLEFSEINIKIHRVDVKKIPEICLDAAIGKTAITVGSRELEDSETEMSPSVIVPDLNIPVNPTNFNEEIYYNRITRQLRTSGDLFPYKGNVRYNFPYPTPTTAGASISFDISSEGDNLWDTIGIYSPWNNGAYLYFDLMSTYSGGGRITFLSKGSNVSDLNGAVAASNLGGLYTVVFKYTNNYKTLNVTLKCVAE